MKEKKYATASGRPAELDTSYPTPTNETLPDGQKKDHWVLPQEERDKGFIRPFRQTYTHDKCGGATTMPSSIAETYARDPKYYGSTFCVHCKSYFPVGEFKWKDGLVVGS